MYWGVCPMMCEPRLSSETMVDVAEHDLLARGLLTAGDVLGVVAGTRQASGSTNFMRLHTVTQEEAGAVGSGRQFAGKQACRGRPPKAIIAEYVGGISFGRNLGSRARDGNRIA